MNKRKKLALSTETLRNLDQVQLNVAAGGMEEMACKLTVARCQTDGCGTNSCQTCTVTHCTEASDAAA